MKHNFKVGQVVYWHSVDFESDVYVRAVISDVKPDHCIADTQGNNNAYDDMHLWIDEDTEMDFFDWSILGNI